MDSQQLVYAVALVIINAIYISVFVDQSINVAKFSGVILFYYLLVVGGGYAGGKFLNNEMIGSITGMVGSVYLWVNYGKEIATTN